MSVIGDADFAEARDGPCYQRQVVPGLPVLKFLQLAREEDGEDAG